MKQCVYCQQSMGMIGSAWSGVTFHHICLQKLKDEIKEPLDRKFMAEMNIKVQELQSELNTINKQIENN